MPPITIKRKDSPVKAVRRSATRQLDTVIESLTGPKPADPALARRELLRLQALLHLVRRPLTGEVFTREHRVVMRGLKALAQETPTPRDTLIALAAIEPKIDVQEQLDALAATEVDPPKRRKKTGPDPKLLRLVADLAEMRMRARYWHLPEGGFELLASGLRQSYQKAAKLRAVDASPAEFAAALGRLANQLQAIEKSWPELISTTRKALRSLERCAQQQGQLSALRPHLQDPPDLLARLDDQLAKLHAASTPRRDQLFVESPPAFAKRLAGIWDAWRA